MDKLFICPTTKLCKYQTLTSEFLFLINNEAYKQRGNWIMKINSLTLQQANVTIVYDNIDRDTISRDRFRKLLTERPIINEFPDILLVLYQLNNTNIIFENTKVSVNKPINNDLDTAALLLAKLAKGAEESVEEGNVTAYGYNLNGIVIIDQQDITVGKSFKDKFFIDQPDIENICNGKIEKVSPKFSIKNDECEINILLDTTPKDNEFIFSVNIHHDKNSVPNAESISENIISKFELFKRILEII